MKISAVVPVYGCPAAVAPLCERLTRTLSALTNDYEIIMVNDACPKNSWAEIEKVCRINSHVVGIELARNFGQIRAITAGSLLCNVQFFNATLFRRQLKPFAVDKHYLVV